MAGNRKNGKELTGSVRDTVSEVEAAVRSHFRTARRNFADCNQAALRGAFLDGVEISATSSCTFSGDSLNARSA